MDSKKLFAILGFIYCAGLVGCGVNSGLGDDRDYYVGNLTKDIAALTTPDEGQSQNLVIFDKKVRRIHQFDLTEMKHVRSFEVRNPEIPHYVLYGNAGNYIVDLSEKGISIFNRYNQANHNPIKFLGKPVSAAFLPSKSLVIVYDDLMTVGMMKLDANGEVVKKWVGGASIANGGTIASGDLNADGKLILALSDGSVVVTDPEASMDAHSWVASTPIATGLNDIKWLAPLPKTPSQVMLRAYGKIALLDLTSKTIVSSYDIQDSVTKLSKFNDPHVVMQTGAVVKVAYAKNSAIQVKTFYTNVGKLEMNYLLSSNLDLTKNTWSFVDTTERTDYFFFNDVDASKKNRHFVRYDFDNVVATHEMNVANDTQVEIADDFIFALFPRALGYGVRYDIDTERQSELARFNLKYIPAD
ncbi:MAG: hypothetical protein JSU04_12650 [Bdellovibrionales bacterium]|nr:hypothetical protein [Bdellovibrionales bacterium]